MDTREGPAEGIARLADLVGSAQVSPETDPRVILDLVATGLQADAVIAGRADHRLHIDHVCDRSDLGLRSGTTLTLHDQHFGARIQVAGNDETHAHFESILLAGAGGPCRSFSVPLFTREGRPCGRLCAIFCDARVMTEEGWTLLRLAGRVLIDIQEVMDWQHQALHDPLTGLPNRLLLRDRLQQALVVAHRESHQVAVMLLDLDDFKSVNDTLGHQAGDALLCQTAARLRRPLRESDTVARLGGDEFVVVLPNVGRDGAIQVARKVLRALRRPFQLGDDTRGIWASIGIAVYPDDGSTPTALLEQADVAMYRAKGREGGYLLASPDPRMLPAPLHIPRAPGA